MNRSIKLAYGAIITALCVLLMILTAVITIGTYSLPAIAGVLLISAVIEFGRKYAFVIFFAVSILSLLIAADKQAVFLFIAFLGYYPIIKGVIEKNNSKLLQNIIKIFIFDLVLITSYFVFLNIFGVPKESLSIFGVYLPWVFFILFNIVFFVYDYALTGLVHLYITKIHVKIKNIMKL